VVTRVPEYPSAQEHDGSGDEDALTHLLFISQLHKRRVQHNYTKKERGEKRGKKKETIEIGTDNC